MPPAGEPHVMPVSPAKVAGLSTVRGTPLRIAGAANDNHRTHAPWRRLLAASLAALFAASLILVGLVCIANAGEPQASFTASN